MIAVTTLKGDLDIYNYNNTEDKTVLQERITAKNILKEKAFIYNAIFVKELEFETKYKLVAKIASNQKYRLVMFTFDSSLKPNSILDAVYLDDIKYVDGIEFDHL